MIVKKIGRKLKEEVARIVIDEIVNLIKGDNSWKG
jgi:hypothetical protein